MIGDYDDIVLESVRIAQARERHGVKESTCTRPDCKAPAVEVTEVFRLCAEHKAESDATLDATWPPVIE